MSPRARDETGARGADGRQAARTQALLAMVDTADVGQEVASIIAVQRERRQVRKTPAVTGDVEQEYVPLASIRPSPWQPRSMRSDEEVAQLASAISAEGLVHPPAVRPRPGAPGEWELTGGHLRIDAMRLLAERGDDARGALVRRVVDGIETVFVPVTVRRELSDGDARRAVIAENLARSELAHLDAARAVATLRQAEQDEGRKPTNRSLAADLGSDRTTISRYLTIAEAITPEVLIEAGLTGAGGMEVNGAAFEALRRISLPKLYEIARLPDVTNRIEALRALASGSKRESTLIPAGDEAPRERTQRTFVRSDAMRRLPPNLAARALLDQVIPAIEILRERVATDREHDHSSDLLAAAEHLDRAAVRLRGLASGVLR